MAKVTDDNRIPDLVKQLTSLNRNKIRLGINAPSGDKLYMIAWVHEYGIDIKITPKMRGWFLGQGMPLKANQTHITIPERAYFRTGFDANKSSIDIESEKLLAQLFEGDITARKLNNELGEFAADKISGNVTDVGLVKTGALRDAIGYRVVRK